jgi:hypothetical protein
MPSCTNSPRASRMFIQLLQKIPDKETAKPRISYDIWGLLLYIKELLQLAQDNRNIQILGAAQNF